MQVYIHTLSACFRKLKMLYATAFFKADFGAEVRLGDQ